MKVFVLQKLVQPGTVLGPEVFEARADAEARMSAVLASADVMGATVTVAIHEVDLVAETADA